MTALARLIPRWLRGPWVADDPAPDLSWLDRADGRTDPLPALPRDWLDDLPSGDLAAMAAPLDVARSCPECGYTPPDANTCVVGTCTPGYHDVALIDELVADMDALHEVRASIQARDLANDMPTPGMARDDLGTYAEPVVRIPAIEAAVALCGLTPDPIPKRAFERLMADVHEFGIKADAFADGRAYESGSRCRTESAAMKRASEHLAAPDGARRAALVLAGFTGAEAWAV